MRLFAAIDLPAEVKQRLTGVLEAFSSAVPPRSVRWVQPEGMHLTLRFFGEVDPDRQPPLEAMLRQAAAPVAPFRLGIEGLGVFPRLRQPRVVWAGVTGDAEALARLQGLVEGGAQGLGFRAEARDFQAHMTLGRVNANLHPGNVKRLIDFLETARVDHAGEFEATNVTLFRSELRPGGPRYTALFAAPLAGQPGQAVEPPAGPEIR